MSTTIIIKDELIALNTAELAKKKGFDVTVDNAYWLNSVGDYYLNHDTGYFTKKVLEGQPHYAAPTQTVLQRWLREIHEIIVLTYSTTEGIYYSVITWYNCKTNKKYGVTYDNYEDALGNGLRTGLNILTKNYT